MNLEPEMLTKKLQMLTFAHVMNEQKVFRLKLLNQSSVLKEAAKFPKHGFLDGTFDKWFHKATFWYKVNAHPSKDLNLLSFN
jgi:hypothetical protein